jgi:transcriptional regulator GlxA family with amidase domain
MGFDRTPVGRNRWKIVIAANFRDADAGSMRQEIRRIALVTFPRAQMLDVTGPLEVFSTANREWAEAGNAGSEPYEIAVIARRAGPVVTSSGVEIVARRRLEDAGVLDTLIVAGGEGTESATGDAELIDWIRREGPRARRLASVCSGAFLLARAGLLDGRRATTHWRSCDLLARLHPKVRVDPDPIFVRDGSVYTSAGICAGMDLALALVEEDLGREIALSVARRLVIFLKRPGGQSQFSAQLRSQLAEPEPLRELQSWISEHPGADLSVPALAARVSMSPRNFARVFGREVGTTPARYVERARVDAARRRLEESDAPIEGVADDCGFGTTETMRRAFLRNLRVSPAHYRGRFRSTEVPSSQAHPQPSSRAPEPRRAS